MMHLDMIALRCPPPDRPQSISARFGAEGGVIGRGRSCTLALPDPSQQISRRHVEIRYRNDEFSLKVVSETNGIHINDVFVRPGAAMPLADGDRIVVGEYEFLGRLVSGGNAPFDMFSTLGDLASPAAKAPSPADNWLGAGVLAPTAPVRRDLTEESLPTGKQPGGGSSPFDAFFPPSSPRFGNDNTDTLSSDELDKLLQGLSGAPSAPTAPPAPPARRAPPVVAPQEMDLLIEPTEIIRPDPPPKAQRKAVARGSARLSADDLATEHTDVFSVLSDLSAEGGGFKASPEMEQTALLLPVPAGPVTIARESARRRSAVIDAHRAQAADQFVAPAVPVVAAVAAVPAVPAGPSGAALIRVLAQSLGLEPGALDESRPEATIKVAGELLRLSMEGVHRLLEMRAQLKGELGVEDRTTIRKAENNPLKESESLHDAVSYLVDVRQHGNKLFMPPPKAVEDALWDICAHEMALMAGTRAALLASLKLFSPEVVESRIKKSGALDTVLPALYKSKLWDRFLEMYNALEREAEDHFDKLLNHEFAKAYGEQSKKLRRKATKIPKEGA